MKHKAPLVLVSATFFGLVAVGCIHTTYRDNGCNDGITSTGEPCGSSNGGTTSPGGSTSATPPNASGSSDPGTRPPEEQINCAQSSPTECQCLPASNVPVGPATKSCGPDDLTDAGQAICCADGPWPSGGACTCAVLQCRVDAQQNCDCVLGTAPSQDYDQTSCQPAAGQVCCMTRTGQQNACYCGSAACAPGDMPVSSCDGGNPLLCNEKFGQRAVPYCL